MKTVAVIPCYNEERFIGDVVTRTIKYVDRVVVTDDCSDDDTVRIAQDNGAIVCRNECRLGFGGNLMAGIKYALGSGDEEIIVTLDGDGQHRPEDIPNLIELINKGEAMLVIGSRFLNSHKCPFYRKVGIDVITWLYNVGCGEKITDAQSCLRAYWRGLFKQIELEDNGYGFSTEILVKMRRLGYPIKEVPIHCIYHPKLHMNSTMNPVKQGVSVALSTVMWRLKRC